MFARLKNYSYGAPMAFDGQFTVGTAFAPGECGVSEARYVFSSEDAWIAIIDGKRMQLFGNPPRQPRAVLLRDRNHSAWRGPVEDVNSPCRGADYSGGADRRSPSRSRPMM